MTTNITYEGMCGAGLVFTDRLDFAQLKKRVQDHHLKITAPAFATNQTMSRQLAGVSGVPSSLLTVRI